jgi:1-acyl-sn-glycerol-3-phosphate acyltransferase
MQGIRLLLVLKKRMSSKEQVVHRLLNWLITPIYIFLFFSILCVFHILQLGGRLFGKGCQKWMLDRMNLAIVLNIRFVTGASYKVVGVPHLPKDRSIIIVSNHQSMYDIPMMMWECRAREVGFIAKKELGRWIPSISMALRTLGSVLIDRADPQGSVAAIRAFGERKEQEHQVAAIFPEGTRARDGVMKRFKVTGFRALFGAMSGAVIQPVAIRGNWELLQYKFLPVPFGTHIELEFLPPVEPAGRSADDVLADVEARIRKAVEG